MLFYSILPSQRVTLLLIPYHFTISPVSQNSIFIKILFLIFFYYFFPTVTFFQTWFSPINLSKPITTHIEPHTHKHKHKPLNLQQSHTHTNHQTSWSQQRPPHLPTKPSISKAKPLIRNPSHRFETQAI